MPANECIAYMDDGNDPTVQAAGAVVGRRFLRVSAAKQIGSQALSTDTLGGNIIVATCGAGQRAIGVAGYDQVSGGKLPMLRGHKIVPVEAGAAMAAGDQVMSDATGRAITWTSAASEANARLGVVLNAPTAAGQIGIVALDL